MGEKKAVNDRLIPSPSPNPLPKGEGEPLGSPGRAGCAGAFGRAGRSALAPSSDAWDRSQHSPNVEKAFARSPSPRGRGPGEGEGFVRLSNVSPILQVTLPITTKIAKNQKNCSIPTVVSL